MLGTSQNEESLISFTQDLYWELLNSSKLKKPKSIIRIYLDGGSSDLFFSPLSVYSALSLAFAGSAGKSRDELLTAFHLEEGDDVLADIGKSIKSIFEQDVKKTMVQANGAFIDGRLDVLGEYKTALVTHFGSDIQEVSQAITVISSYFI